MSERTCSKCSLWSDNGKGWGFCDAPLYEDSPLNILSIAENDEDIPELETHESFGCNYFQPFVEGSDQPDGFFS